ncbi:MAG: ATP-binding protein [Marinoscillum sp.]
MRSPIRCFTIVFYLLFIVLKSSSQGVFTRSYQSTEGLDTDIIKCITQDSLGFIWVGSDDGLFRYDGINFIKYPHSASSQYFKDFTHTSDGRLLAVHDLGIIQINSSIDSVSFQTVLNGQRVMSDTSIWYPKRLYEDGFGNLWIAEPQSIVRYHDGQWKRFKFNLPDNTTSFVRSFVFLQLNDKELVIISNTGNYYIYQYATEEIISLSASIKQVTFDIIQIEGTNYLGTANGLFSVSFDSAVANISKIKLSGIDSNSEIRQITPLDNKRFVVAGINKNTAVITINNSTYEAKQILQSNRLVNQVYASPDKSIWLSTEKGALMITLPDFKPIPLDAPNSYMEGMITNSSTNLIYTLRKESIWTVDKTTHKTQRLYSGSEHYFLSSALIENDLWVSSGASILKLENDQVTQKLDLSATGRYIFDVEADSKGFLWFGQESVNGIYRLNTKTMSLDLFDSDHGLTHEVTGIQSTPTGVYVLCSNPNNYLFYKANDADHFTNLSVPFPKQYHNGLTMEEIEIQGRTIWFATNFGVFKLENEQLEKIQISKTFDYSAVRTLRKDKDFLWIATTSGLVRYNIRNKDFAHFIESSGLPVNTVNKECLIIDDGQIWVGTSQGVAVSDHDLNADFTKTKKPHILEYSFNGERISTVDDKVLNVPFESFIGITFSSLIYPSNDMQYNYRMNQGDWSSPQNGNKVNYSNLSDGFYTFTVRAKRMGNYAWSDPTSISFIINPPFYKRAPFYLLVLIVIGAAVLLTLFLNSKIEKRRQQLLTLLVKERTEELNAIKNQLEHLVDQRTKELKNTVDQLTNAQDQLIQAEKMASLGVLTAGIAHEINNPVNYLKGGLYSLDKLLKESGKLESDEQLNSELTEVLGFMKLGMDRITNIVSGLSRYSRKSDHRITPCNLHDILNNCLLIMEHEWKGRIEVNTEMSAEAFTVLADEGALHQLFINIITNAIHAMSDQGNLIIETSNKKNKIEIRITDSGEGIDEKDQDKLFDPFYTTKPPGHGTGLGLFISKKIISQHKGDIYFRSKKGKGTSVFITFNLTEA